MLLRLKHRILPLAWYEMLLGLRSPGGLAAIAACCAAGLLAGGLEGTTPSMAFYRTWRLGAIMLGFLCLPLLASAARRDTLTAVSDVIDSRPQQAHELLLARWLGNYALLMTLLLVLAVAAFGSQAAFAHPIGGQTGAMCSARAFVDAVTAAAVPLMFLCALGYCAAELLQNVLAAAIVALYWILVLMGRDYLSRVFDLSLSQNNVTYILLSAGVVFAAMAVVRYRQGLHNSRRLNVPITAAVFLSAGLIVAVHFVLTRHDPPMHAHEVTLTVAGQSIRAGRLPGFWLPDQHGKMLRMHEHDGEIRVVSFWSPADPDSTSVPAALQTIHEEYSGRGVQVIGVCLSDDWSIGRRFARQCGYQFPMVTDRGTHWADKPEASSPLAEAYEVTSLPATFIADGGRNLVSRIDAPAKTQTGLIRACLDGLLGSG